MSIRGLIYIFMVRIFFFKRKEINIRKEESITDVAKFQCLKGKGDKGPKRLATWSTGERRTVTEVLMKEK